MTSLLNDLGAIASDKVLVLDDYHVIDDGDVQDGMVFLLDHLPPRLHLRCGRVASYPDRAMEVVAGRLAGRQGFKPSPITAGMVAVTTPPTYRDIAG